MSITTGEERSPDPAAPERRSIPVDSFAARLRLARMHANDITIKEAAERCGLNYGSWSNWERGSRPLGLLDVVEAISEGLDIDRNWLLFGGPLASASAGKRDRHSRRSDTPRYRAGVHGSRHAPDPGRPPGHAIHHRRPDAARRPVRLTSPIAA
jgi:transcriptional regulator with XRE-family HTH domain